MKCSLLTVEKVNSGGRPRLPALANEPSSLFDLKEIGGKSAWPVHISLLF
jgi:hypothetical protein